MKIQIDYCPAGPAIDAMIEWALGCPGYFSDYVIINGKRHDVRTWIFENFIPEDPPAGWHAGQMPRRFSVDIAIAWELVKRERMRLGWTEDWDTPYAACRQSICEYGEEHPLAICRAFLKARGVAYIEVLDD